MLEDFIATPADVERMRSCMLGTHLDGFCNSLHRQGYARFTVVDKLRTIVRLVQWMGRKRLGIVELTEHRIE